MSEQDRKIIPAMPPSKLLGEPNKNVYRSTLKTIKAASMLLSLYGVTVPFESLIKALEFSPKHKHTHLPTCNIWQPVSEHP